MQKVSKRSQEKHIRACKIEEEEGTSSKNMEGSEEKNLQLKHKMIQYVEKKRTPGNVEGKNIWLKTNWV